MSRYWRVSPELYRLPGPVSPSLRRSKIPAEFLPGGTQRDSAADCNAGTIFEWDSLCIQYASAGRGAAVAMVPDKGCHQGLSWLVASHAWECV